MESESWIDLASCRAACDHLRRKSAHASASFAVSVVAFMPDPVPLEDEVTPTPMKTRQRVSSKQAREFGRTLNRKSNAWRLGHAFVFRMSLFQTV